MKLWKLSNTDVSKLFLPLRRLDNVDISRLVPEREASSTMENMRDFLKNHHSSGQMVGFEMNYEDSETTFNVVTDRYKYEQTLERFNSYNQGDEKIEVPDDNFISVEEGDYVSVVDFGLNEDYWRPLPSYKQMAGGRDPLDKILTEMAGRNQDMSFSFQVISKPIEKHRWSHRYSIQRIVKGMMRNLWDALPLVFLAIYGVGMIKQSVLLMFTFGLLFLFTVVIQAYWENKRLTKDTVIGAFIEQVTDGFESIVNLITLVRGLEVDDFVDDFVDNSREKQKIQEKAESNKGYMTQIRLIAVGDSADEVNNYTNSVVKTIEETYSEDDSDVGTKQGLVGTQKQTKNRTLETGAEMVARDTGIDFNRRFTDKQNYYWLRNKRNEPMILTPDELASIMHFITDTEHSSIKYR